jgi:hypothetical protein
VPPRLDVQTNLSSHPLISTRSGALPEFGLLHCINRPLELVQSPRSDHRDQPGGIGDAAPLSLLAELAAHSSTLTGQEDLRFPPCITGCAGVKQSCTRDNARHPPLAGLQLLPHLNMGATETASRSGGKRCRDTNSKSKSSPDYFNDFASCIQLEPASPIIHTKRANRDHEADENVAPVYGLHLRDSVTARGLERIQEVDKLVGSWEIDTHTCRRPASVKTAAGKYIFSDGQVDEERHSVSEWPSHLRSSASIWSTGNERSSTS